MAPNTITAPPLLEDSITTYQHTTRHLCSVHWLFNKHKHWLPSSTWTWARSFEMLFSRSSNIFNSFQISFFLYTISSFSYSENVLTKQFILKRGKYKLLTTKKLLFFFSFLEPTSNTTANIEISSKILEHDPLCRQNDQSFIPFLPNKISQYFLRESKNKPTAEKLQSTQTPFYGSHCTPLQTQKISIFFFLGYHFTEQLFPGPSSLKWKWQPPWLLTTISTPSTWRPHKHILNLFHRPNHDDMRDAFLQRPFCPVHHSPVIHFSSSWARSSWWDTWIQCGCPIVENKFLIQTKWPNSQTIQKNRKFSVSFPNYLFCLLTQNNHNFIVKNLLLFSLAPS